jgi:uncharacterized protein DUF6918
LRTLQEILLAPDTQPRVIDDCMTLIQQEVSELSGISGAATRVAYKAVISFAPDHVRYTVETKLPQMVSVLEPYWADFGRSGGGEFGDYLAKHSDEVSNALLSITDASAASPSAGAVVVKAYRAVRGHAAKNVSAALPRVGALVQSYA